jgi:putative membrane protein
MCYWSEGASTWGLVAGVLMLLFWAAIIGLAIWLVLRVTGRSSKGNGALSIARERYARGEISKEEFDRIRKDLS